MESWVRRTFEKDTFGIQDFCIDCGRFVTAPRFHKQGLYHKHLVVKKSVGGDEYADIRTKRECRVADDARGRER